MSQPIPLPLLRSKSYVKRIATLAILLAPTLVANSQNTLDKAGLPAAVTASAAYSVRLLSSAYTGKALQIRRSSDNTTQDIGFTANGDLDSAALKTFVGANSGYVSEWYDQSGNGQNITQTTAADQPILVNAGVINRESAEPFIRFWGYPHTNFNSLVLPAQMTTVGHVAAVMKFISPGYGFILSHSSQYYYQSNPGTALYMSPASSSVLNGTAWVNGSPTAITSVPWPTSLTIEELEPQTANSGTAWDNIGSDRGTCCHEISGGGGYSELIVFPTTLTSADRTSLEATQSAYYGLTVLSLSWLDFTARLDDQKVFLQWETAAEQNSKSFEVQYSTDATAWTTLTSLPAAGNSTTARTYSYVHYAPQPGNNYYRIRELDANGASNYSTIQSVELAATATNAATSEFLLMQNPVINGAMILKVLTPTTLSLYTTDGKLLRKEQYLPGLQTIPMEGYPKGLYILTGKTKVAQVLSQ